MLTQDKSLSLLLSVVFHFFTFCFLSFLAASPENSVHKYSAANSYSFPFSYINVVNVYPAAIGSAISDSSFEGVVKTKTITIHSDEILNQKLNLMQGEFINAKAKTETFLAEKVTFNPHMASWSEADWEKVYEDKKIIQENTKKEIKKVRVKKQVVYTGRLPGKRDMLTNSAFVNLKNYNGYGENIGEVSRTYWREKNSNLKIVLGKINSAKYYPLRAKKRGLQGDTLLRLKLKTDGRLEKLNVLKSSGSRILDRAAINTVKKAAPFPYINGSIDVVVSYQFD